MEFSTLSIMDDHPIMGRSVSSFYKDILGEIEAVQDPGFHAASFAEHHFSTYGSCPDPPVLLSAPAQRTERLRLGVAVSVLAFHNPIEVAEQNAMVDILSEGRLKVAVGRGILAREYEGFRVSREESAEHSRTSLEWRVFHF